jgi:triosephosphate isomerase
MNPVTREAAVALVRGIKKSTSRLASAQIVVAPPFVYIDSVGGECSRSRSLALGAQDVFPLDKGSYTGEISLGMLQHAGVKYVIVGHSERRALGESDAAVQAKLAGVIKSGMTGIVCVGETARDASGQYLSYVEAQLRSALSGMSKSKLERVVIAYEPVWAIGTGTTPTSEDIHEMRLFIERVLADVYGRVYARKVRILYGGSVQQKNARELFSAGGVDGFLVGGASLRADEFAGIVKAVIAS